MILSLCFLLTLASYGFLGVQSRAAANYPGPGNRPFFTGFVEPYKGGNGNNEVSNKVQQPSVTFLSGGIFAVMGVLPTPKPSDKPSEQPSDDYSLDLRAETAEKMKEFDEKLASTLKALDELEQDVKAGKSNQSTRFMQYN